jgi:hypothetical protein
MPPSIIYVFYFYIQIYSRSLSRSCPHCDVLPPTLPLLPDLNRLDDHRMGIRVLAPSGQPRRVRHPEIARGGVSAINPWLATLSVPEGC